MNTAASPHSIYSAPKAVIETEVEEENSKWYSVHGRIGVIKNLAHVAVIYLYFFAVFVAMEAIQPSDASSEATVAQLVVLGIIAITIFPVFYVGLCLWVKRFHDLEMSGWMFLVLFIPIIGGILGLYVTFKPGAADINLYGVKDTTKAWEKVVGSLMLFALLLFALGFTYTLMSAFL